MPETSRTALSRTIKFDDVDIVTPAGDLLVSRMSLAVSTGQNLLVTGCSGAGKTSLVRVLGGLWPLRNGTIELPQGTEEIPIYKSIFVVPQAPYSVIGSLADQISYPECSAPAVADPATARRMEELLSEVKLLYLLEREGGWGATRRWEDVLSLGEQQRLGMARLFFHCPVFAVLDQCTDAVSVDIEAALYASAAKLGITIITTSQRPALTALHGRELKLSGDGTGWELWAMGSHKG